MVVSMYTNKARVFYINKTSAYIEIVVLFDNFICTYHPIKYPEKFHVQI